MMVIMPEKVSAVEEVTAQGDPVTAAIPEKEVMVEAEALTITDYIVMAPIAEEEEALAEPPPTPG